ncbi:hypothetical protein DPMN_022281 [Dreissena polymorpha]|uniref:Uncharacterized protein n=1 Tax=Dreissena polymorpha TaxID=45954 RepID=A0A9D4SCC8_DREPO|nr:hypothetical protein DPMN_022281 [Dreissena polymorpha]
MQAGGDESRRRNKKEGEGIHTGGDTTRRKYERGIQTGYKHGGYKQERDASRGVQTEVGCKQGGGDTDRRGNKQEEIQSGVDTRRGDTSRRGYKQEMIQTGEVQKEVEGDYDGIQAGGVTSRNQRKNFKCSSANSVGRDSGQDGRTVRQLR